MTAEVSMEIQYVRADGTLTYDGANLFRDLIADTEDAAAAVSIDSLADVTITSALTGQVLRYNGTAWVNGSSISPQTPVSASSQTSIDYTGIPAWVNRITVMMAALSTNGTSLKVVRIGDGAIVATGYTGGKAAIAAAAAAGLSEATGFGIYSNLAADTLSGSITIDRFSGNTWVASGILSGTAGNIVTVGGGSITLTGALDRLRITTLGGVDTFDAGSVNVSWQ